MRRLLVLTAILCAVPAHAQDSDGDGILDGADNCVLIANGPLVNTYPGCFFAGVQVDTDGDGFGDSCDGDFNNDAVVNATDTSSFVKALSGVTPYAGADMNCDSVINATDVSLFVPSLIQGFPGVLPPTFFVLAGQSNMVGRSTMPPVFTSPTSDGRVSLTYQPNDYWKVTEDPLHTAPSDDLTSAWPTFAGEWMTATGWRGHLIATAQGGSCLLVGPPYKPTPPLWDPDAETGTLYWRMLEQVAEANPGSRLRAVLWYQGECEVTHLWKISADPYTDYKAALEHLADRIGEDLGVPMVVAPVSLRPPPWPYQPTRQPIHDATIDAAIDHPYIYLGPDTDDLEHEDDGAHIHDVVTLGERWFDAVDLAGLAY